MTGQPISLLFALLLPAGILQAAERTWDGTSRDDDWMSPANWVGGVAPVAGDSLRFPAGAGHLSNSNDFPAGTIFEALTYSGAGYTARGSSIALNNGIAVTHGSGNTSFYLPITLRANQTFMVTQAGANLFLNGDVNIGTHSITFDGAGQTVLVGNISDDRFSRGVVRKLGAGRLVVFQPQTYDGNTLVNGGTLAVESTMDSTVIVNAGGTVNGTGRVGGLRANAGGVVQPGSSGNPDIFDSTGNVELNAGSSFNIRLNGTSVGVNYDQLRVEGTVTLGGTLNVSVGFVPAVGEEFTIIDNDGTDDVVGTFAGLPEGAILTLNGRPFKISYGGRFGGFGRDLNNVTLEAVPALSVWDGGGGQNRRWSQPLNWVGDALPLLGDDIRFPSPVTTTNDFPAGREFGSITFGTGTHRVDGNAAVFNGNLNIEGVADIDIYMPLTLTRGFHWSHRGDLTFHAPITLGGSQVFWVDHSEAILTINQGVHVGPYQFTLRNVLLDRAPYPFPVSVYLYGMITGTGRLIKDGPGQCRFWDTTIASSEAIINEGWIDGTDVTTGLLTINAGGRFSTSGTVADVIVHGTFAPSWPGADVNGDLQMLPGSTFAVEFDSLNPTDDIVGSAYVTGQVTLAQANLSVTLYHSSMVLPRGSSFRILNKVSSGTFAGLPEGSRIVVGRNSFIVSYQNGVTLTANLPYQWDGGGSGGNWTTGPNWVADVAPLVNERLIFPAGVSKRIMTNDFASGSDFGTAFDSLVFDDDGYTLHGNLVRLTNGIFHNMAGQNVIAADVRFTRTGEVFVAASGMLRLDGIVTNTAGMRKTGPGRLRLGGIEANSTGPVNVLEGQLDLLKSGAVAVSGTLTIGDGASPAVVNLFTDHQIVDTVNVVVRANASLALNSNSDEIGGLSGDGLVALGAGRLAVRSGNFAGVVTGAGGLTKTGVGSFVMSGNNTFSGSTILDAGSLQIDGVQTASTIMLNAGTLTGVGRVGSIQGLGGTVRPGRTQAVAQNQLRSLSVTFNASTTFEPYIFSNDPDFENSRLTVTGTVALGGSTLHARRNFVFNPAPGSVYLVLENDGADPISGTFAGLPEGALTSVEGLPFRVSYVGGSGNDVVLTRASAPPATLTAIEYLTNGQVRVQGIGLPGLEYRLQAASNLNPLVQWIPVGNPRADSNGVFQAQQFAPLPQRFYRVQSP